MERKLEVMMRMGGRRKEGRRTGGKRRKEVETPRMVLPWSRVAGA
jgi:hypothetical protein